MNQTNESNVKSQYSETSHTCPICNMSVSHRHIKPKIYIEQKFDVDRRPIEISWLKKGVEQINPRLFYMMSCPHCKFTAAHKFFEDPAADCEMPLFRFQKLYDKAKNANQEAIEKVYSILSSNIDLSNPDLRQAVQLHLLAIFQHQLIEDFVNKDAMNLARYSLRLGWLFRDIKDDSETDVAVTPVLARMIEAIKPYWPDIPDGETASLKMARTHYQTVLSSSPAVKTAEQEILLLLLISRIEIVLEEIPDAQKCLMRGVAQIRSIENEARKISTQSKDEQILKQAAELKGQARRLKLRLDDVRMLFDSAKKTWEKKQSDRARAILKKHPDLPKSKQRELLLKNQIHKSIVTKIVPEKSKKAKKGFFDFFK